MDPKIGGYHADIFQDTGDKAMTENKESDRVIRLELSIDTHGNKTKKYYEIQNHAKKEIKYEDLLYTERRALLNAMGLLEK